MKILSVASMESPVGGLTLVGSELGLFHVFLPCGGRGITTSLLRKVIPGVQFIRDDAALAEPLRQIREYFEGRRKEFSVELDIQGTAFQMKVWKALALVRYGETESYAAIGRRIGRPAAARAVGAACGANPVPIIVPCHRIVGKDGSLTGFAGGMRMKKKLLELEKRESRNSLAGLIRS
jgi:O-6-methylguanine DNA methyltransferase